MKEPDPKTNDNETNKNDQNSSNSRYRSLVIDSGPIIKLTGISALRDKADQFYTVPAVLTEIRDAKARDHLQNLPFDIVTREPSPDSINAVAAFSRLTGDYRSLSNVDLLVLALVYELEKEGCNGSMEHIRTEPKRTVGIGKLELLNPNSSNNNNNKQFRGGGEEEKQRSHDDIEYDIVEEEEDDEEEKQKQKENELSFFQGKQKIQQEEKEKQQETSPAPRPKSWALLVNPAAASKKLPEDTVDSSLPHPGTLYLEPTSTITIDAGQFSDAEEEEEEGREEKGKEQQQQHKQENPKDGSDTNFVDATVEEELQKDFPSLAASLHVPFEGEDHEIEETSQNQSIIVKAGDTEDKGAATTIQHHGRGEEKDDDDDDKEQRKKNALKPLSKSGKTYNSFRGYGKLFKPATKKKTSSINGSNHSSEPTLVEAVETIPEENGASEAREGIMEGAKSRIIGGMTMSGQEVDIEDDGEGWVTCTRDIRSLQAAGTLAPPKNALDNENNKQGPLISQRAACATTDFAMQNVILQMNLELLSVDGVKVRRLKTWVTRCGACFKVYTKNDDAGPRGMKRLFCERCGSDMLQRIAASVDAKTGRLRLHMSKKYKNSTRGTKFSLPKAGTGNRFQGDLLLREDQLLMGAWNQKVKMRSGGKAKSAAQSMFGHDIAANVGCKAKTMNVDDIAAGFGRRNPNSSKGGRERRGKKKKSKDKACGLRRYH